MKPTAIIAYILANSPVSHSFLEERATNKHGLSLAEFDKLMVTVSKHYQISSSVKGDDVWYRERVQRPKAENPVERFMRWKKENPYPVDIYAGQEPYFKCCFCALFRADDGEIYDAKVHGHRANCDALRWPEEFANQHITRKMLV